MSIAKTAAGPVQGITVASPKVGERDDFGGTRVTAVSVAGTVVTITVWPTDRRSATAETGDRRRE